MYSLEKAHSAGLKSLNFILAELLVSLALPEPKLNVPRFT